MNTFAHSMISAWSMAEIAPWKHRRFSSAVADHEFNNLNCNDSGAFIYEFTQGTVALLDKPLSAGANQILHDRAAVYLSFFQEVIRREPLPRTFKICVEVHDCGLSHEAIPTFSFQKLKGQTEILLPDINLIEGRYYDNPAFVDVRAYDEKPYGKAVFVGSTSGEYNTLASVQALANPRINAAVFFRERPEVDFWLPNIVQADDEGAGQSARLISGRDDR